MSAVVNVKWKKREINEGKHVRNYVELIPVIDWLMCENVYSFLLESSYGCVILI